MKIKRSLAAALLMMGLAAGPLFAAATVSSRELIQEQGGRFGFGAHIGVPFGLSAKYLIDKTYGVDFALGAQGSNLDAHSDFIIHLRDLWPNPPRGKIPAYIGIGGKIEDQDDTLFGIRFVAGVAYLVDKAPIEIFGEVAPVLRLAPSTGSNLEGGVGLRYYFGFKK